MRNSMKRKMEVNPLEGGILRQMLLFALPVMGAALLQMLFSAADTAVIGRFGHPGALSAIGVSSAVINLLVGGLTALDAGVTVAAGRRYGQGDREGVGKMVSALPPTALLLGGALAAAAVALADPILGWMNCPAEIRTDARLYFRIYFLGVPFLLTTGLLSAVLQARGNSFLPFLFQIGAAVINIALNLVFVIALDWNIAGVAAATVISEALCAGALTLFMARQRDETRLRLREMRLFRSLGEVFSIGIPSSLEGIVLNLSGVIIAAAINRFDAAVIAGNTVGTTIEGLIVVSFTGFANASVVFISQNYGKGNFQRIGKIYRTTILSVFLISESLGIAVYALSPVLTRLFTQDALVMAHARTRMFYMCLFFGGCGVMNVISGCVRGLGEARLPLIISILCSVVFRVTWIYTYAAGRGTVEAIYVSYPLCWGLCVALNAAAFHATFRKKKAAAEAAA